MIRFLIVSDLHITSEPNRPEGPSLISCHPENSGNASHMFDELIRTLEDEDSAEIDWLICPGDLGDRADEAGIQFAWRELHRVAKQLEIENVLGTAGNHDFRSRLDGQHYDPAQNIKHLYPKFPTSKIDKYDQYWSRHFYTEIDRNARILNVNSSAFHGYQPEEGPPEYDHGRIDPKTIEDICEELSKANTATNILITHHHIFKNDHIYQSDYSEMEGAGKLIHNITKTTQTPWIVFHGHQHYPELDYGRGSNLAPVVLSAGTFSARLSGTQAVASPNQFYVVEIQSEDRDLEGWFPCGRIQSWQWNPSQYWVRTPSEANIPFGAGFGCKINPNQGANYILQCLQSTDEPYLTLADIQDKVPITKFILPSDLGLIYQRLAAIGVKLTLASKATDTTLRLN